MTHHRHLINLIPRLSASSPFRLSKHTYQQEQNLLRPLTTPHPLPISTPHHHRTRPFSTTRTTKSHHQSRHQQQRNQSRMLTRADLSIADSTPDQESLVQEASQLVDNGGRWRLCREGKGIERGFKFRTFKTTWVCLNSIFLSLSCFSFFFFSSKFFWCIFIWLVGEGASLSFFGLPFPP